MGDYLSSVYEVLGSITSINNKISILKGFAVLIRIKWLNLLFNILGLERLLLDWSTQPDFYDNFCKRHIGSTVVFNLLDHALSHASAEKVYYGTDKNPSWIIILIESEKLPLNKDLV